MSIFIIPSEANLKAAREEAIVAFVIWMERSGFPASKPEIEDAATTLRQRRNPDADPVNKMWYSRFRNDHPELEQAFLKAAEQSRESWEAGGLHDLQQWFKHLTETIRIHKIGTSECWDTDQAGIRIGILKESIKVLVVRTKRRMRKQVLSPSNRETCTLIGTGSAAGDTMPPWLIFKTFPTSLAASFYACFEKSGIYPPNPEPAMAYLAKKQLQGKQAMNPAFASLLPHDSRFQTAADTAKRLSDRYGDAFSSPTRAGLRQICNVVTEAMMLESTVTAYHPGPPNG
ncbi:hypothetical protein MRS44_013681 [Fusarium solani]|uniref:uncharacterized protein n=1 Tax=Fusarium solani TaxID=169388 RepID=UPI0032C4192C|nr:hypothetical protein MRS44_013681 [Fusarium solani]